MIGVAWDGTGYGLDGHIWGGEFFVGDYRGFRREAYLEYLPMPGGDAAVLNPWRLALGYVYALTGRLPDLVGIPETDADIVRQQVERSINTPQTSAAGRLFDAIAALIGVRSHVSYEAQAAIELEMLATQRVSARKAGDIPIYPFVLESAVEPKTIRLSKLFEAIRQELEIGTDTAEIALRFHQSMAAMLATVCRQIAAETGLQTVALSGGCFQNRLLLALAGPRMAQAGLRLLVHRQVPCNDGGLSLGQAALAHFVHSRP